jgi:Ni,Fe-hydrogenase III small subunit
VAARVAVGVGLLGQVLAGPLLLAMAGLVAPPWALAALKDIPEPRSVVSAGSCIALAGGVGAQGSPSFPPPVGAADVGREVAEVP